MKAYLDFLQLAILLCVSQLVLSQSPTPFAWPQGKQMALSLSFDDGRDSQPLIGVPLLDEYGAKATFYIVPPRAAKRLDAWKKTVASGHEIGNHSVNHPCSGNFVWARPTALEDYTLAQMRAELREANQQTQALLGVTPTVFAYPCGATFVGRGVSTQSYVPVVAELFQSGRLWLSEAPNSPDYCDFAQLTGMESDGKDFDQILPLIEAARQAGQWLVLAGHDIGEGGRQTTRVAMLRQLIQYAQDPANGIWLAPVGEVGTYVQAKR
jgi:peptidoglycan/xylan/chitin deacetylase (PgdA/CDA1 family)